MTTLQEVLRRFTAPEEVILPTNRFLAYRVGPEWRGMRHLLLIDRASLHEHNPTAYLLQIEIVPSPLGPKPLEPYQRLTQALHRSPDEMYRILREAPRVDLYCPYQAFVMEREIAVSDQFDRLAAPWIADTFGLVMEWTSKSHPLRQMAMPELVEAVQTLLPSRIRPDRTYRELRSLLKNGLPLVTPDTTTPFGEAIAEVTVAALPFHGERTDLVWVTPSGARKLQAWRHFDVPEQDYRRSFAHCQPEAVPYHREEQTPFGTIRHTYWRGRFVAQPPHCKVVTSSAVKGMTALTGQYYAADGTEIDLIVDTRSVESKDAWEWFPHGGEDNVFLGVMHAGITDHAQHYHRPQQVSVRPELHLLGRLSGDPIQMLKPQLERLEELWRMAQELELAYV